MDFSFGGVDPEELLQRLTLYAYILFGCFPDPSFEPMLHVHGCSPEDLSINTMTKFLDPDDHSVKWSLSFGAITMESLLAYLKPVLLHDFIDMKRKVSYKRTTYANTVPDSANDDDSEMTLDSFIGYLESPESKAVRAQQREWLLAVFEPGPDLQELLTIQLDPEAIRPTQTKSLLLCWVPPSPRLKTVKSG